MSFGESIFSARFIQKTVKADLDVRLNHAYPQQKQLPEGSRRLKRTPHQSRGWPYLYSSWPLGPTCQPPVAMLVLHHLLDCIYVIYSSRFDPRAYG